MKSQVGSTWKVKFSFSFILFFILSLLSAQDLASARKRLTEMGTYKSILRHEDKNWSYQTFKNKINDSNGAFLRTNPRPTSADIKKDLLQEVFYFLRMQSEGMETVELNEIKERLYKTLAWWVIDKPQFRWTDSALDQPRYLGTILILLYDTMQADLSDPTYAPRIKRIQEESANYLRYTWNFGKAEDRFLNLGDDLNEDVQRMGNVGYRLYAMTAISAALDREDLMGSVSKIAENQIQFHINTGQSHPIALMPDFALHQHNYGGGQIYNLGYGLDWFNDFVAYAYYVKDSKWALEKNQLNLLAGFLEKGIYPFFLENNQLVQQALGRHNQVKSTWIKFPESRAKLLRSFFSEGSDERKTIDRVLSDLDFKKNTGFNSFYSSDFLIADLPKYTASIRLVSDRTSGQESGDQGQRNGMQNFFSSDGSFIHYKPGFDEVKGAWDWRKVPGTTAALIDYPLPATPYGKNYSGFSSYAGVLNTEKGALISGNLRRKSGSYELEMVKSYLLLQDVVLFWGVGLKYGDKHEVHTTVTQESLCENAFFLNGSEKVLFGLDFSKLMSADIPIGVWNVNTGYIIFPVEEQDIQVSLAAKSTITKWEKLDQRNKPENNNIPLLTISIKHSENSIIYSDSYFYLMIPDISEEKFIEFYDEGSVNFPALGIEQIRYSGSNLLLAYDSSAWFVNFRKAAKSEFTISDYDFSVSGLIGGSFQLKDENLNINITQMEKRGSIGQDFVITIDNFGPVNLSSPSVLSQPLKVQNSQSGIQISGNTETKNPLDFGSTFSFYIPLKSQQ
ncbi:Polysaccharide lyase family 8, super-sandwich domain [Algoriphagus ornithinivorans]|uniref:Polysaccharide lyase family 8, super-sandwich domain n=1 Tax=Algoriphagus ornithinivorans TaxID=226506 RepID=A0A1I5HL41_9BACT|nr:polysaccharide lyase family 8 super-sandwich domain-containing protein [Algoriphagus ornithinivorans]SFO48997.1 Polysaccharide lyase family 8, super-sandwich domain [Algoriphagus ornithinivorans]